MSKEEMDRLADEIQLTSETARLIQRISKLEQKVDCLTDGLLQLQKLVAELAGNVNHDTRLLQETRKQLVDLSNAVVKLSQVEIAERCSKQMQTAFEELKAYTERAPQN